MCKISVIVPIYNVEKYIEKSIKAICRQTFKDFQVVLVDDGTQDDSAMIAEKILRTEKTNYKILHQKNSGLPAARNTGLRNADGEYVVFVDSDDIIEEDFLSCLYSACVNNNVYAAFTDYQITNLKSRNGKKALGGDISLLSRNELLMGNMLRKLKIHLCAVLLEKEFLIENSMWFNEKLRYGEEVDYTWRLYPKLQQIAHVKSPKYKYLIRENSLMTSQNIDRVKLLMDIMHEDITLWFKDNSNDSIDFRWVESKIYFEKMHAFAEYSSYDVFKRLLIETDYVDRMKGLRDFPDFKIQVLAFILKMSPALFWGIFQIRKL